LEGAQVVVISSAVSPKNVEVITARERSIPVIPRAEMLAELMRLKYGIAIAGAHGKTTTTSMVATVLAQGGLDPTAVIGGKLNSFGGHAKLGQGEFLVAEADESDGSFLKLTPTIAVVTNIDREHLDFFKGIDAIRHAFLQFVNKVPFYGLAVLCQDQVHVQELIPKVEKRILTFGITSSADLVAKEIELEGWKSTFSVTYQNRNLGRFQLTLPGIHNVYNALAAIGVGLELELDVSFIQKALSEFSGVERRFQCLGEKRGILIIDDYGHHPTEVKATLDAVRAGWSRRVVVLFQPHRYTRTRDLMKEFSVAFHQADSLIVTDIYPAGEERIEGIHGEGLVKQIQAEGHPNVTYQPKTETLAEKIGALLKPGDILLTLGAGDIGRVGREVYDIL
jgi:UDP-N-acetylmuramate--alanine ligase